LFGNVAKKDRYGRDREAKPFDELKDYYHLEDGEEKDETDAPNQQEDEADVQKESRASGDEEIPELAPVDEDSDSEGGFQMPDDEGETGSSEDESSSEEEPDEDEEVE